MEAKITKTKEKKEWLPLNALEARLFATAILASTGLKYFYENAPETYPWAIGTIVTTTGIGTINYLRRNLRK